jgi:hypothetical protein
MARPSRRPRAGARLGRSSLRERRSRDSPDRLESSSLSAALNPRAVPSVSRNFTVNASYCLGVTCTSSGSSEASEPLRACFGDAPNASRRSLCCSPLASDARRFEGLPAEGGDGFGDMPVWPRGTLRVEKRVCRQATRSDSCLRFLTCELACEEKSSRLFAHCFRRRMRCRPLRDAIGHVSPSFQHRLAALDHSDVAHAAARFD